MYYSEADVGPTFKTNATKGKWLFYGVTNVLPTVCFILTLPTFSQRYYCNAAKQSCVRAHEHRPPPPPPYGWGNVIERRMHPKSKQLLFFNWSFRWALGYSEDRMKTPDKLSEKAGYDHRLLCQKGRKSDQICVLAAASVLSCLPVPRREFIPSPWSWGSRALTVTSHLRSAGPQQKLRHGFLQK